jgi:hypothetical protein
MSVRMFGFENALWISIKFDIVVPYRRKTNTDNIKMDLEETG